MHEFTSRFFSDPTLPKKVIERQSKEQFENGGSSVTILARMMIEEGRDRLLTVTSKVDNQTIRNAMLYTNLDPLRRSLLPADMNLLFDCFTVITVGVTIRILEIAKKTQELDLGFWVTNFNYAVDGTQFLRYKEPEQPRRFIPDAKYANLKKYIDKDRTYASFFGNSLVTMPDDLRITIQNHYFYHYLNFENLMELYKPVAHELSMEASQKGQSGEQARPSALDEALIVAMKRWQKILHEDETAAIGCGCNTCRYRAKVTSALFAKSLTSLTANN